MNLRTAFAAFAALLTLASVAGAIAANWPRVLANVLISEGGNDDDPRDPGGRTSRGIIQREWNAWRQTHPGLPADVWKAPQSQVEAIYRAKYWDVMRGDELPAGVDYSVADYSINSGIGRGGKVLRCAVQIDMPIVDCVRVSRTWEITPDILDAVKRLDAKTLIRTINDERIGFLRRLPTYKHFGGGWSRRVASVRSISLSMANGVRQGAGSQFRPAFGPHKAFEEGDEVMP